MAKPKAAAVMVQVSELKEWARNPRLNDGRPVNEVAKSIRRFGFASPIVALADNRILAGHTRLKAARQLGLETVPVRYVDLSDDEAIAYALADNKLGELADWDADLLGPILEDICGRIDVSGLGWTDAEILEIIGADPDKPEPSSVDAGEPPPDPVSAPGEVYELGPHRLICGDCTKPDIWEASGMAEASLVYADPPYGMSLDPAYDQMHDQRHPDRGSTSARFEPVTGDDQPFDVELWSDRFSGAREEFWWGADYYRSTLPEGGSWVVWDKRSNDAGMDLDAVIGSAFELCWSKVSHRREIARILWSGHHGMQGEDTKKRMHPTQKPTGLARWFFERWSKVGDMVADPFLGSGTTLLAAAEHGLVCRGGELSPAYCDVIRKRWGDWARLSGAEPGPGAL